MADNEENNKDNKKKGEGIKLFIGRNGTDEVVVAGDEPGKYTLTVQLGQNRRPATFEEAAMIFANGEQIGDVEYVQNPRPVVIKNVPLDPKNLLLLEVRRTGQDRADHRMPAIDISKIKKPTTITTKPKLHFDVLVGPLTSDLKHIVSFTTYDENFVLAKGSVSFSFGQPVFIDGTGDITEGTPLSFETGSGQAPDTNPLGKCSVVIQLKNHGERVRFSYFLNGETEVIHKTLLAKV